MLKELKAKYEKAMNEYSVIKGMVASAEGEEAKKSVEKNLADKKAEIEKLNEQIDKALEDEKFEKSMGDMKNKFAGLEETVVPEVPLGKKSAEATDHLRKAKDQIDTFQKYMKNEGQIKALSGEELKLLAPKESNKFGQGAKGGVAVPPAFAIRMLGTKWAASVGYSQADINMHLKASTMVSSTDALGGYTVPQDYRPELLNVPTEQAHILQRATVIPAPTGEITMPKAKQTDSNEYGGMVGEWINEAGLKPKTDTRFEQISIPTHEFAMHTQVSTRLLSRSAISMEQWMINRARGVIMDAMDTAFINGDGNGKPIGILQTDGIREVARASATSVSYEDLVNLKYSLRSYHRSNAIFVSHDDAIKELELKKDNDGRPLFTASTANGIYDRLIGYNYVSTYRNPDLGTDGDVFFCDLNEYYIPMEQDIVIKRSDDYDIVHNLATFVFFVVVGGKLVEPRVCSVLGDGQS